MINKSIFKSYDVRGVYPLELNEEAAFNIGAAFIRKTGAKKVVIGHDARLSGPELFKALTEGILAEGGEVYDIGMVPTEGVYFAVGQYEFPAGIMITASHNPKEYNGFKMMILKEGKIEMVRGLDLIPFMDHMERKESKVTENKLFRKDIWRDYANYVLSLFDLSEISPFKIIADASDGIGWKAISEIKDKLPGEIIPINDIPNGEFPNHGPNPLIEGASKQAAEKIKSDKADFGFMFDADADRIFLLDENGKMVPPDITLLLLAKHFLEKNPGMSVAYNLICSRSSPDFIKKFGGNPIKTMVGFVNVRDGLLKHNGIMGGEMSGHYCFKDYFFMDSGIIAMVSLMILFSKNSRNVSELVKELELSAKTDYNFELKNKEEVMNLVKEKFSDGNQDFMDGITVEYKDWWFNLRPSNTEPLLRLTIEANTQEILEQKMKEIKDFIVKLSKK